jgi:hypothetical protein
MAYYSTNVLYYKRDFWSNRYRRLKVRYERRADIHQAFLTLGCALNYLKFVNRFCQALEELIAIHIPGMHVECPSPQFRQSPFGGT